jgi:hypothetical protein
MTSTGVLQDDQEPEAANDPPKTHGQTSRLPTRKWLAGLVAALGGFAINVVATGGLSKELTISLIGILSTAIITYLVPNQLTPGGYPVKRLDG